MIKRAIERPVDSKQNLRGGPGTVSFTEISTAEEIFNKGRLFVDITLVPGAGIGYHIHENETEIYYVIEGNPTCNDNGTDVVLNPGDVAICGDGDSHSLINNSDKTAQIVALIITK